jgi:hypothetical protein
MNTKRDLKVTWFKCRIVDRMQMHFFRSVVRKNLPELVVEDDQILYCNDQHSLKNFKSQRDYYVVCVHPMHRFGKLVPKNSVHILGPVNWDMDSYVEKVLGLL